MAPRLTLTVAEVALMPGVGATSTSSVAQCADILQWLDFPTPTSPESVVT